MQVRVEWSTRFYSDTCNNHMIDCQLVVEKNGIVTVINADSPASTGAYTSSKSFADCPVQTLDVGDRIYIRARKNTAASGSPNCSEGHWLRYHQSGYNNNKIQFEVTTGQALYDQEDLHDVKLSHNVKILGFELEDIKIPSSIADKVQGFRIYRAKRKHEDKRILGQGVITPMLPRDTVLGLCSETSANEDASQILASALSTRESVYHKEPFTRGYSLFPTVPQIYRVLSNGAPSEFLDKKAYKAFSFNDFNLLRTQNSLAGVTHIKPEYKVRNFVWNGPTLNQPKKMVSKIIEDDGDGAYSEPIKKIEQFWGWDTEYNCYSKKIGGSIFAGCWYTSANSLFHKDASTNDIRHILAAPRLIGQKAKSYIPGDSIFQASALGFGGKVVNEFGESSIIFSLKDRHEIPTETLFSMQTVDETYSGLPNPLGNYSWYHLNHPSILTNPLLNDVTDQYNTWLPSTNPDYWKTVNNRRSEVLMVNLHAFKTDMYKSIDNQELVWTGFEILGDDLNNFIFDEDGAPYNYTVNGNPQAADYKTDTVQGNGDSLLSERQNDRGIFGGDIFICRYGFRSTLQHNHIDENSQPRRAIHYHIVESTDNINFRHSESDSDLYFPGSIAKRILQAEAQQDFTHQDNLNYDDTFSAENDLRPAFPLPLKEIEQTDFPTRAHRSAKRDTTSLTDNYRIFLANQFKDAPKNRGELWKLSSFNNLLYFHMEESLYVTKGKQQMQMKDGTEAFVGSGDIFQQDPDEIMQADKGYGGTQSQWAALTTNYGYFFVDVNSRKVFLMQDKLTEVSNTGLENWFKDNLPFALEQYSFNATCLNKIFDNPIIGLGLTAIYDPKFKRILLTKKDLKPTADFITGYNLYLNAILADLADWVGGEILFDCDIGQYIIISVDDNPGGANTITRTPIDWDNKNYFTSTGWTISYYPEFNVWCGFHDYTPYIYFNTSDNFYSINKASGDTVIWEHNSGNKGQYYGTTYPFEVEYIHNEFREEDTLLSSFNYTLEAFNSSNISVLEHGFTSFFVYNTLQISDESTLDYLINIRRIGNNWKVNSFRDMAALVNQTGTLTYSTNPISPNTSSYYTPAGTNVIGQANTGTITTSSIQNMFTVDGMSETINSNFIDSTKNWDKKRKFVDKWAGIRLIYNNLSNNLLNLYSAAAAVRKTYK